MRSFNRHFNGTRSGFGPLLVCREPLSHWPKLLTKPSFRFGRKTKSLVLMLPKKQSCQCMNGDFGQISDKDVYTQGSFARWKPNIGYKRHEIDCCRISQLCKLCFFFSFLGKGSFFSSQHVYIKVVLIAIIPIGRKIVYRELLITNLNFLSSLISS